MHMHACLQAWPVRRCFGVATHATDPHKKKMAQQTSATRPCSGRAASKTGQGSCRHRGLAEPQKGAAAAHPKTQRTGTPHGHTANSYALKASILQPRQSHLVEKIWQSEWRSCPPCAPQSKLRHRDKKGG